jgi:hypothetical protein
VLALVRAISHNKEIRCSLITLYSSGASSALFLLQRLHGSLELPVHRLLHDLDNRLQIALVALAGLALDVLQETTRKLEVLLRGGLVVPTDEVDRVVEDLRGVGGGRHVVHKVLLGLECARALGARPSVGPRVEPDGGDGRAVDGCWAWRGVDEGPLVEASVDGGAWGCDDDAVFAVGRVRGGESTSAGVRASSEGEYASAGSGCGDEDGIARVAGFAAGG